jgi:hypothetical protein
MWPHDAHGLKTNVVLSWPERIKRTLGAFEALIALGPPGWDVYKDLDNFVDET